MIFALPDDPTTLVVLPILPDPQVQFVRFGSIGAMVLPSGESVDPQCPCVRDLNGSTSRWMLTGTTRDSAGAALGACRVIVLEVGRLAVDGAPVVAETVSDGAGSYSVAVPTNTAYQVLAYKPGAPDVTGATLNTVTPTQV